MVQQHGLRWGALDFVSPEADPPAEGFLIHAMANGTTFGNPEADYQTLQSLLRDGAVVVRGGRKNRLIQIRLAVSAPTAAAGPALVAGEAALANQVESDSPPPLAATPSLTGAATAFFDVVIARDLEWDTSDGWDLDEVMREVWYFTLTLECLPFPRTESKVIVPAIPVPPETPTTVNIDTCDSFAGWAATYVTLAGTSSGATAGYVFGKGTRSGPEAVVITLTRSGAVAMGATPYLKITAEFLTPYTIGGTERISGVKFDGGALVTPTARSGNDYYFIAPASFTTMAVISDPAETFFEGEFELRVHNVARTDTIPGSGTTRQRSRTAEVRGSAPTQAATRLYDATSAALGSEILVYASTNTVWQPPLRKWRASGSAVTADATLVSGGRNTLGTAMVFRIPANLLTERTYALRARMNVTAAGTLGWSVKIVSSAGADVVGSSLVSSGSQSIASTGGPYRVLEIADLGLVMGKPEGDQMVQITITGTANMTVDEMWLFGLDAGVLNWLRDTESMTWIEIRPAVLGAEKDAIYGGTGTPGVGGVDVTYKAGGDGYGSIGVPEFKPGLWQFFTVTTTSLVSQSEIEFYPRGHSHVLAEWAET